MSEVNMALNSSCSFEETSEVQEETSGVPQKTYTSTEKHVARKQCEFCLEYFIRLDKHSCKMKDDVIRILEKQLNIKIDYIPKDKCRFCDCAFSRADNLTRHQLTCKAKIDYKEQLEKQIECKINEQSNTHPKLKRKNFTQRSRMIIASSQNWKCNICDDILNETFQVDHIIEIADGGETKIDNGQALCPNCHAKKTHANWVLRESITQSQSFSKQIIETKLF
jgi:hypothetical protein